MSHEALVFTDELIEIPVTIGEKKYTLKEASGDTVVRYKNAITRATTFKDGKLSSVSNINDSEPLLVSLCLFQENGLPVSLTLVRSFKNSTLEVLFDKAKEISNLDQADEEDKCEHDKCQTKFCSNCGEKVRVDEDTEGND
tara:strand:+ start:29126 stop:29548 length:423 start_codon:yes stop_codon:yes gene_type:complete